MYVHCCYNCLTDIISKITGCSRKLHGLIPCITLTGTLFYYNKVSLKKITYMFIISIWKTYGKSKAPRIEQSLTGY
jgi:hypothetical protein